MGLLLAVSLPPASAIRNRQVGGVQIDNQHHGALSKWETDSEHAILCWVSIFFEGATGNCSIMKGLPFLVFTMFIYRPLPSLSLGRLAPGTTAGVQHFRAKAPKSHIYRFETATWHFLPCQAWKGNSSHKNTTQKPYISVRNCYVQNFGSWRWLLLQLLGF